MKSMRSSLILATGTRGVFHTILLFSLFLLFSGHNAPGGGFIGGLVAAAALVLRWVVGGSGELRAAVRIRPEPMLGLGLALALVAGVAPWAVNAELLSSGVWSLYDVPLLGDIKATSVLVFDIGVYCIVVGLVMVVLSTLGAEQHGEVTR